MEKRPFFLIIDVTSQTNTHLPTVLSEAPNSPILCMRIANNITPISKASLPHVLSLARICPPVTDWLEQCAVGQNRQQSLRRYLLN